MRPIIFSSACLPTLLGNADVGSSYSQIHDFPCERLQVEPAATQSLLKMSELQNQAFVWTADQHTGFWVWTLGWNPPLLPSVMEFCLQSELAPVVFMTSDIRLAPLDLSSEQGKICLRKALQHNLSTIFGLPSFKKKKRRRRKVPLFPVKSLYLWCCLRF